MSTKNNPGKYDCYAKAAPDEPMFVLLARDPVAPFLVSLWAKVRMGDANAAFAVFQKMRNTLVPGYYETPDVEKACEAMDCSAAMFEWTKNSDKFGEGQG
jgi:hypothetical protein